MLDQPHHVVVMPGVPLRSRPRPPLWAQGCRGGSGPGGRRTLRSSVSASSRPRGPHTPTRPNLLRDPANPPDPHTRCSILFPPLFAVFFPPGRKGAIFVCGLTPRCPPFSFMLVGPAPAHQLTGLATRECIDREGDPRGRRATTPSCGPSAGVPEVLRI